MKGHHSGLGDWAGLSAGGSVSKQDLRRAATASSATEAAAPRDVTHSSGSYRVIETAPGDDMVRHMGRVKGAAATRVMVWPESPQQRRALVAPPGGRRERWQWWRGKKFSSLILARPQQRPTAAGELQTEKRERETDYISRWECVFCSSAVQGEDKYGRCVHLKSYKTFLHQLRLCEWKKKNLPSKKIHLILINRGRQ